MSITIPQAIRLTAIRAFTQGAHHGHEATVEGRFIPVSHCDETTYFEEAIEDRLSDGSLPEAVALLQSLTAPADAEVEAASDFADIGKPMSAPAMTTLQNYGLGLGLREADHTAAEFFYKAAAHILARALRASLAKGVEQTANLTELRQQVRVLLDLMGKLDPNGGRERHPEWPLQIRGDEDASSDLCAVLNRLQEIIG